MRYRFLSTALAILTLFSISSAARAQTAKEPPTARIALYRVAPGKQLAHGDDHLANIGRRGFAQAEETLVSLDFDDRLARAGIEPACPPQRRFERDVDGGRPDPRDLHVERFLVRRAFASGRPVR